MHVGVTLLGEPLPVELMNTVRADRDTLDSDSGVVAWLRAVADRVGVETARLDDGTVAPVIGAVRALRDALRLLAAAATGDPRPLATSPELTRPDAIATLNELAQAWPELVWPPGGLPSRAYRAPGTTANLAVRLIAHQGVELFTGVDRHRLRPCLAPKCLLFFVKDHARREWCSPACGNRARVARHYRRHRH